MLKRLTGFLILSFLASAASFGQVSDPGPSFQYLMMKNPSLAGTGGVDEFRLSYLNYYPGNTFNLHSVFISYDTYLVKLHGGAAIYIADDYLGGIINEFRGGLSYAYFFQAAEDLFINAGLSASVHHRGLNFQDAVLPDQIDPLGGVTLPSSELLAPVGRSVFDISAGFVFISGKFEGGFSLNHLAEPFFSGTGYYNERLKRVFLVHFSADLPLNDAKKLKIGPLSYLEVQNGLYNGGVGASIESKYMAINAMILGDSGKDLNIQAGFSLKTGKMTFYYNYRFKAISDNTMIPLSLLHQTGLAFSLNNVEKRKGIKTINFPKL